MCTRLSVINDYEKDVRCMCLKLFSVLNDYGRDLLCIYACRLFSVVQHAELYDRTEIRFLCFSVG